MPTVRILSTGGTIASTGDSSDDESGKTPSISGDDLVEAVPELADHASIEVEESCQLSGFQMDEPAATAVVDAIEDASGVDGIVVTHGTDTMAEAAYYRDVVAERDLPVVYTGAQRPFDQLGTDGPANLVTAVRAAVHDRFREAGGTYLAFNDRVHAARWVVKRHTSKLETFTSPTAGPVAELTPNGLRFLREPGRYAEPIPGARIDPDVRVEIVTNAMGVDGRQVERALEDDVDGFVLAGTGLGNATADLGAALERAIDDGVPVVRTSRCHDGTTAGLYGGDLPPWKARVRLTVALSAFDDLEEIRDAFRDLDTLEG